MLISLSWIKDYVDLDGIDVDTLVSKFGLATAEVESVTYKGKDIKITFTVIKIFIPLSN